MLDIETGIAFGKMGHFGPMHTVLCCGPIFSMVQCSINFFALLLCIRVIHLYDKEYIKNKKPSKCTRGKIIFEPQHTYSGIPISQTLC